MRFGIAIVAGVVLTAAFVVGGRPISQVAEESPEEMLGMSPTRMVCEAYGIVMDRAVEARFPSPKPKAGPVLIADDSGYTGVDRYYSVPIPKMEWECSEQQLTVWVHGPWIFEAVDLPAALENALRDLRREGLEPTASDVAIVLNGQHSGDSVRFDPARDDAL
jgi:hypothetical protein